MMIYIFPLLFIVLETHPALRKQTKFSQMYCYLFVAVCSHNSMHERKETSLRAMSLHDLTDALQSKDPNSRGSPDKG